MGMNPLNPSSRKAFSMQHFKKKLLVQPIKSLLIVQHTKQSFLPSVFEVRNYLMGTKEAINDMSPFKKG